MANLATNYQDQIEELNSIGVFSVKEAIEILKELENLKGKLVRGSVLEKSIENYLGEMEVYDVAGVINALENLELKTEDEFNTSEVSVVKINELVDDYQKYLDKGLSDKEAVNKIYKENKGRISVKNIEQFVQKQREIKIENTTRELNEKILADLKTDKNLAEVLKKKQIEDEVNKGIQNNIKKMIDGESNQNNKTIVADLAKIINKVLEENNVPVSEQNAVLQKQSLLMKNVLEVNNFIETNETAIRQLRKDKLKESIIESFSNETFSNIKKEDIDKYAEFVAEISYSKTKIDIDKNKDEIVSFAESQNISPGKIENGWGNLESLNSVLNSPQKIDGLIKNYNGIVDSIGGKIPIGIKKCDSLDLLLKKASDNPNFKKFIDSTQKIFNTEDSLGFKIASALGLHEIVFNVAGRFLGPAGIEFAKQSLVILAQRSFEEGSFIILQSFIGGGIKALGVTAAKVTADTLTMGVIFAQQGLAVAQAALVAGQAAGLSAAELAVLTTGVAEANLALTGASKLALQAVINLTKTVTVAGTTAAEIGTAAATGLVPVVGWIIAAVMAVSAFLKPVFDKVKNFLSDIGMNFTQGIKDFLSDNFGIVGKFASWVVNLAEDVLIMIGAVAGAAIGGVGIIIFVIIGLFAYQIMQGGLVSSLVPPQGEGNVEDIPIDQLPTRNPNMAVPEGCPDGWPTTGIITQGPNTTGSSHTGIEAIDIAGNSGKPIYATHDGIALPYSAIASNGKLGYYVRLEGTCNGKNFNTSYGHLPNNYLRGETVVKKGDLIGYVDNSGNSTGPHLHYQLNGLGSINNYLPKQVPNGFRSSKSNLIINVP